MKQILCDKGPRVVARWPFESFEAEKLSSGENEDAFQAISNVLAYIIVSGKRTDLEPIPPPHPLVENSTSFLFETFPQKYAVLGNKQMYWSYFILFFNIYTIAKFKICVEIG